MKKWLNWFVGEESGQSMVEYGLIIGLIAVVLIGSLSGVQNVIKDKVFEPIVIEIMGIH